MTFFEQLFNRLQPTEMHDVGADERKMRAERARLAGLAAYKADDLKCAQVPRNSVVPGARGCKRGAS